MTATVDRRRLRVERNRARWGSVAERADELAAILRDEGPLTGFDLSERTGMNFGAIGGALSDAKRRKLVRRKGGKWEAI